MQSALQQLSDVERAVLQLASTQGLGYRRIAEILAVPEREVLAGMRSGLLRVAFLLDGQRSLETEPVAAMAPVEPADLDVRGMAGATAELPAPTYPVVAR